MVKNQEYEKLLQEFKIVQKLAKENPGMKFYDPRFAPTEPVFKSSNLSLQQYLEDHFPKYDFIGPRIGPSMVKNPITTGKNELFVEADLTDNGLTDYVAFIRSKKKDVNRKIVAFLQENIDSFVHQILPTIVGRSSYIYITSIGEIRKVVKKRFPNKINLIPDEISDERSCVVSGMAFRHLKGWLYHDGRSYEIPMAH